MAKLQHAGPTHIRLPDNTDPISPRDKRDIGQLSRQIDNNPVCVGATGTGGGLAAGAPGASKVIVWTPNANKLYDAWSMISGPTNALGNIRIPRDGFYDFWLHFTWTDVFAVRTQLRCFMQKAPTSTSGYAAPVFASIAGMTASLDVPQAGGTFLNNWSCLFRGVELHAHDLVRFQEQQSGTAGFAGISVDAQEFRYLYPIPTGGKV